VPQKRVQLQRLAQVMSTFATSGTDWEVLINLRVQGQQYAHSANESRVAADIVTNARTGWPLLDCDQRWEADLGVVNLFGRDYYDDQRINGGFGRYYELAPGRTVLRREQAHVQMR
jgi:iron complex outermembrane recepter protein